MQRRKKIYILLVVLALSCLAAILTKHVRELKETIHTTDAVIVAVPRDTVESLSWKYDSTSLAFHKDGNWLWDDDASFPVNEEKINDLLSCFESLKAAFVIEDVEDLSQYGLNKPVCTISLVADGKTYDIVLGDYSAMDSQRYVSIGDGNVYLVENDPFDSYEIVLSDTILNDKVPSFGNVSELSFSGVENYTIGYSESSDASYCSSDVYFTEKDGSTVPLDTYRVEDYYASLTLLSLTDYVSYNVTDEELAAWGLDEPALTVSLTYTPDGEEEQSFVIHFGQNAEELAKKTKAEAAGESYSGSVSAYARIGDSPLVYEITSQKYSNIIACGYDDLRHKELLTADFETVSAVDITLDGVTYTLTSAPGEGDDAEPVFSYNGNETDITDLRSKLKAVSVTEFTSDEPGGKEEISLVFHLNNSSFPEVTVSIYRQDGSSCLAVLDGQTLGLVSRSKVVDLIEAVNTIILG